MQHTTVLPPVEEGGDVVTASLHQEVISVDCCVS